MPQNLLLPFYFLDRFSNLCLEAMAETLQSQIFPGQEQKPFGPRFAGLDLRGGVEAEDTEGLLKYV